MKRTVLGLALALLAAVLRSEGGASAAPSAPEPAGAPAHLRLTGRWGFGFDSIPGASTGTGWLPGFASPNALAIRYWINESLAWDGLLAAELSSRPEGGAGGGGLGGGAERRAWGVGTVFKVNLRRPTRWLLVQGLARASLAQLRDQVAGAPGQTTTTFAVGAAAGFEAFLPLWDALSVEGSVGLDFSSSQIKADGVEQAAQSGSSLRVGANGFTPLSLAIHLYF